MDLLKPSVLLLLLTFPATEKSYWEFSDFKECILDNWKPLAAGTAIVATGVCLYKYFKQEKEKPITDIETYKRETRRYCQIVDEKNKKVFELFRQSPTACTNEFLTSIIKIGSSHPFIKSEYYYLSEDARGYAPLLRGGAIMLHQRAMLLNHKEKIVNFYGSEELAKQMCDFFDQLNDLRKELLAVYYLVEGHPLYHTSAGNYEMYRTLRARPVLYCC